jgi:N-acetylglucosaminyldiphosphoundecaprenol N-acetyl-beta-D-mannosaminyltransferase
MFFAPWLAEKMNMPTIDLCGVSIHNLSFAETLAAFEEIIDAAKPSFAVTPNVDHIVKLQNDEGFRRIYRQAALVLADGMPLLWAARFLGTPLKEKISGSDLFPRLCEMAAEKGWKVFFMGGRPGAAEKAGQVLTRRHPELKVVGACCPAFGFEKDDAENCRIVAMIRAAAPDIVFVGLGAPKQEKWIDRHKDEYGAPVSVGIGVSFEFVAGMVRRAPAWMQKAGLEWFWRIIQEPGRLWKRYLVDDMQFFALVWKQKREKTVQDRKNRL